MTRLRRAIAKSWMLSKAYYLLHGLRIPGRSGEHVWHFAYGANMNDGVFRGRRKMRPLEWRAGRVAGYRLRFNLEGRPKGKAAPANLSPDRDAEVWGVFYRITRADLVYLDFTEGVPGSRYRQVVVEGEDIDGERLSAVTYVADGKKTDGNPSLRYITLIREGALEHKLPDHYLLLLDRIEHAE